MSVNPDGCGAVQTAFCSNKTCDVLNLRIITMCSDFEVKMFLDSHDPNAEETAWVSESFDIECMTLPGPECREQGPGEVTLECDENGWKAFFNGNEMFNNVENCDPLSLEFEISPQFNCVADGISIVVTE